MPGETALCGPRLALLVWLGEDEPTIAATVPATGVPGRIARADSGVAEIPVFNGDITLSTVRGPDEWERRGGPRFRAEEAVSAYNDGRF